MADASSTAAFLLTGKGKLVYANAAAETLLVDGGTVTLQDKCLVAVLPSYQEKLRKLVLNSQAAVRVCPNMAPARALVLEGKRKGQRLQLLASPLSGTQQIQSGAAVLLLATDPEMPVLFPDDMLRAVYNLTAAEADVANGLLMGYSLHEIASLRRVSIGTIRNQVKSLLNKTSTSRQSDLIRLLTSLPQPLVTTP